MAKFQDKIGWVMSEDKILKLQKKNETYDIADVVYEFLKNKGLLDSLEDKDVEVEIDETQGQTGVITYLKLIDNVKESKSEKDIIKNEQQNINLQTKEVTVAGVAVEKKGVIFKEEKNVWYTLDSTINAQEFKEKCSKKQIMVTIAKQDKGNDVIKSYILKEEKEDPKQQPEELVNNSSKSSYSNDVQKSIEAQASVNSANELVSKMTDILNDPQKVLTTITRIAEHNFKTIQDLKNRG